MPEIEISQERCAVCGCSPAYAFPGGPRCPEHYGEPADPKIVNLLKGPSGVLKIGSGKVQGARGQSEPGGPKRNHPERDFQGQVIDLLHLHGFKVAHFGMGQMRIKGKMQWATPAGADGKGFPDIVAIRDEPMRTNLNGPNYVRVYGGLAWELKAGANRATTEQLEWLRLFEMAGFHAKVWYPEQLEEIKDLLESWTL